MRDEGISMMGLKWRWSIQELGTRSALGLSQDGTNMEMIPSHYGSKRRNPIKGQVHLMSSKALGFAH